MNNKKFSFEEMPQAYFSSNEIADHNRSELIKNITQEDECNLSGLSQIFFSDKNILKINNKLIKTIYNISEEKFIIPHQKKESLLIVMRWVWQGYAKNLPYKIKKQIRELNCIVIDEIVPGIITNLKQQVDYIEEINKPLQPIDRPINVNHLGKTLPPISDIFHRGLEAKWNQN